MARGARKSAAAVRELVSSLQAAAPSRKLPPTLTTLHFVVPRKFHDVRTWCVARRPARILTGRELMRRELPRIVYANPELQVRVDPLVEHAEDKQSHASLQVHFRTWPTGGPLRC